MNGKLLAGRRISANIEEGQFKTPQKTGKGGADVSLETAPHHKKEAAKEKASAAQVGDPSESTISRESGEGCVGVPARAVDPLGMPRQK